MATPAYVDRHAALSRRMAGPAFIAMAGTLSCLNAWPRELLWLGWWPALWLGGVGFLSLQMFDRCVGLAVHRADAHAPARVVACLFGIAGFAVGLVLAWTILGDVEGTGHWSPVQTPISAMLLGVAFALCSWPACLCFALSLAASAVFKAGGDEALAIGLMLAVPGVGLASLFALLWTGPGGTAERAAVRAGDITVAVEDVLAAVHRASERFLAHATGSTLPRVALALDELARRGRVEHAPRTSTLSIATWRLTCPRLEPDPATDAGT